MLQQMLFNKTLLRVSAVSNLHHAKKFCSSVKDDNTSTTNVNEVAPKISKDAEKESDAKIIVKLLNESATYDAAEDTNWATTPYHTDVILPEKRMKPRPTPINNTIIMFPGQGIIKAGMLRQYLKYPGVNRILEMANEILGYDLGNICKNGPQEKLDKTIHNQPATLLISLAALEKIREEKPEIFENNVTALGYSLGEITALVFSGAISVEDGIKLVSVRGQAMQIASDKIPQGLLSVQPKTDSILRKGLEQAINFAKDTGVENPVCEIAIYPYTQTRIIGGNIETLKYIMDNKKSFGLSSLRKIPVSGAFHTALMKPALMHFEKALKSIEYDEFRCKVFSNTTVTAYHRPQEITKRLLLQLINPVKWEQVIQHVYCRPKMSAFPTSIDVASGGILRHMLYMCNVPASRSCITM